MVNGCSCLAWTSWTRLHSMETVYSTLMNMEKWMVDRNKATSLAVTVLLLYRPVHGPGGLRQGWVTVRPNRSRFRVGSGLVTRASIRTFHFIRVWQTSDFCRPSLSLNFCLQTEVAQHFYEFSFQMAYGSTGTHVRLITASLPAPNKWFWLTDYLTVVRSIMVRSGIFDFGNWQR